MGQRYSEERRGWARAAMVAGFICVFVVGIDVLFLVPGVREFSAPLEKNIAGAIFAVLVLGFVALFFVIQMVESIADRGAPGQLERVFWTSTIAALLGLAWLGLSLIGAV